MDLSTFSLETAVRGVKYIRAPLGIAQSTCLIGSWVPRASGLSANVAKRLTLVSGPLHAVVLLADTVALTRLSARSQAAKWATTLKKGCDITLWADWCGIISFDEAAKHDLKGVSSLLRMAKCSILLWHDLWANPPDRNLLTSIPKFLTASLLLIVYITDNKKVKVYVKFATKGYTTFCAGYQLFRKMQKIDCRSLDTSFAQICKVISLTALTALSFYVIELNFDFDSLN